MTARSNRLDLTGALLLDFSLWECQLDDADFTRAEFAGEADFTRAKFTGRADFKDTQFTGNAYFEGTQFTGRAYFEGAQFTGRAYFEGAQFTDGAYFPCARVASSAEPGTVWPPGWITRSTKQGNGEDPAFLYLTTVKKPPDS